MKFRAIILVLLLFSLIASAGEIEKITIEKNQAQIVNIPLGGGIEFDILGGRHIITVDKITEAGADLNIFFYVDGEQFTNYVTVKDDGYIKLDFDRDGAGDVYLRLNKIFYPENIVSILILERGVFENGLADVTGNPVVEVEKNISFINWFFGTAIILLLVGLVVALVVSKNKKLKKETNR